VCNVIIALALINFAPAAASQVTATRLDGTAIRGELRSWDKQAVVIATADGEERLATKQLLSLQWEPGPPNQETEGSSLDAHVELIDGSLIPLDDFQSSAARATINVAAPLASDEKELTLPRKQLAAVRLQPLSAAAAQQWQEIRDTDFASDLLVLLKRDGKSLDYAEGVLGEVSPTKIAFQLDGEPLRIDRAKVAGFIYYRPQSHAAAEPRCVVRGRSGLRANVVRAELANGMVQMTTASGANLKWPLDDIHLADFSAGKLIYLSDLEPAAERWTPLVGLPSEATLASEYGRPRRDRSAYGGPLMLRLDDSSSHSPKSPVRTSTKGLAVRSRTELVYRLAPGFRRFTTVAGIDPATSASGNVRLEIYGDDRLLLEDDIAGHDPPRSIELEISGVKRLKILVDYGGNLDSGDWLNLCDARIVK
jgi:hypothetical protein